MKPEDEFDALNFEVEKSIRYHQRRRAHHDRLHRGVMFGVIVSGSAVVAGRLPTFAGLVATLLGALDLVFGLSMKARDHQVLFQRFSDLARWMRRPHELAPADLAGWRDEKRALDAEEPPIFRALEADCYNEVCRAWGRHSPHAPALTLPQRLLMNWWRFEGGEFPPRALRPAA